jgi:hypothetical protein
VGYIGLGGH